MEPSCIDCKASLSLSNDDLWTDCYYCGLEVCVNCAKLCGTRIVCKQCESVTESVPPNSLYKPTRAELDEIKSDPEGWFKRCKSRKAKVDGFKYLLTFTRNPNSRYGHEAWLQRVKKELSKALFVDFYSCAMEHQDTNVHVHAYVKASKRIAKATIFKVFIRDYGYVDVRAVKVDNGVDDYFSKELPEGTEVLKNASDLSF